MRRLAIAILAVGVLGACAPGEENLAVVANAPSSLGTGPEQRVLIGLFDPESGESLASPDLPATVTLTGPDEKTIELPAEFLWTIEGIRGLYVTRFSFPASGGWSVRLHPEGMAPTPATPFVIADDVSVPEVGEEARAVATRTSADHPLEEITTDPNPDPAFYQLSLDQALTNGRPTVVVFATPAFCESQTCGPLLDQVKELSVNYPDSNFVHVEIYENIDAASLDDLRLVPAVAEWGLPSEPWVFVIDPSGRVTARFEGAASDEELAAAFAAVNP
ncbi:MAG: thioredoxin family protein [Acidimicrobiia bacterium]|nr:thioredoxin family protein [Acidimicrobiia bacterium]